MAFSTQRGFQTLGGQRNSSYLTRVARIAFVSFSFLMVKAQKKKTINFKEINNDNNIKFG